jgi:hypothetical protein
MWLLLAMFGAVAASAVVETGLGASDEDEDNGGMAAGSAPPAEDDPEEEPEEEPVEGELIEHAESEDDPAAGDPWLETEEEVEYVSTDAPAPGPAPDRMPFEFVHQNEPGAERDPWLEGWTDDEYASTDEVAATPPGAMPAVVRPLV